MDFDYAVHSDFLIHWTGKDIDNEYEPDWYDAPRRRMDRRVIEAYLKRIGNILEYGLWMTEEPEFRIDTVVVPPVNWTCFTELRLSLSMGHAKQYGRLGFGVKRPFLFDRRGRPLVYYGRSTGQHNDDFLRACAMDLRDKRLLHFFKSMNSTTTLDYDFYAESEWRMVYHDDLLANNLLLDPRNGSNTREAAFFRSLSERDRGKLKYLVPLDGWFAVLIYPGLEIKNEALRDAHIRSLIKRIKTKEDNGNRVEGGNWPVEMCLSDTRFF